MSQIIFRERATPSTPASGQLSLFANTNGDLSWIDDAGVTNVVATLASNTFTGVQILPAGSVTDPSLTTTGDTNTGIYFPGADRMAFTTGGVIRGSWTTSGLCFGSDTAAANALDDYEEGTWTPTLAGDTTAGTYTFSASNALYTKVGRQVSVSARLTLGTASGGAGIAKFGGLPFTKSANQAYVGAIVMSGVDTTAGTISLAVQSFSTISASSEFAIVQMQDNAASVTLDIAGIASGDALFFSFTFFE
jgi:hypothetical protein